MKVLEIKAISGPNYWSIRKENLIVMLLDLEELEEKPTNLIRGFSERIETLLPSLYQHRCSEETEGGFFMRVKEGTWMGHVIEHIALELQTLAGFNCGFGRTRGTGEYGKYHVVVEYEDMEAGKYAVQSAVDIARALISGNAYDIGAVISEIKRLAASTRLGPSTASIVDEAKRRGIPVHRLDDDSLIQLGWGAQQRRIETTIGSTTSGIAIEIAGSKTATKNLLQNNYVPVPEGRAIVDENQLQGVIDELGFPLVIKPVDGNQGKGATTDIRSYEEAVAAFRIAKCFSDNLICEKFIHGHDYRVLVINYKLEAAALRTPANITGDGIRTIAELIARVNEDPARGDGHENSLTKIVIDEVTHNFLQKQRLTLDTVLPLGQQIYLKPTANLSTGGTATDVTDEIHPANIRLFERVARLVNLDICGIDVMAPSLSEPITANGGAIIEVNAAPGFRMHLNPTTGKPRNVAAAVVDMLFPENNRGRIPIMAITGTNGKTTTTRLLAHITKHAGYRVGYTTTDGIYIDDEMIVKGDCTGPVSAKTVLRDPLVDMAVLECARGGILRGGLGFDQCDIAIVTNVADDHLGLGGIDCREKLARVKATVPLAVHPDGYAVLNADDDMVYNMGHQLKCKVAYYSMDANHPKVLEHVKNGGLAAVYENRHIMVLKGRTALRLAKVDKIPITFGGAATFNIANVLAATLAAYIQDIHPRDIMDALNGFIPCPETIPGRMNMFELPECKVIVDYAHNTHGVQSIAPFIKSLRATKKIGVIAAVGDRRAEDISGLGAEAARIFDEIIVRHDEDLRGGDIDELDRLICEGIRSVDPHKKITILGSELHAVDVVLSRPEPGSVSVIFAENIKAVVARIREAAAKKEPEKVLEVA